MRHQVIAIFAILACVVTLAHAQTQWLVRTNGLAGPLAQVALPDSRGKKRSAFIALEYARQCDPLFSYIEIAGERLGSPITQEVLQGSKIGVLVNGTFYTWHAAKTTYDNGFEAAFGITNELALQLLVNVSTLAYVTPSGEQISLPVGNFSQSFQVALEACRKHLK